MEKMVIPAGALFTVSSGCYSDYSVEGVFRAATEIDTVAELEAYLAEHPDQRERYEFRDVQFLAWVARKGLLEPLESWEWHLGDYSSADEAMLYEPRESALNPTPTASDTNSPPLQPIGDRI